MRSQIPDPFAEIIVLGELFRHKFFYLMFIWRDVY